jgi:MFS transporter, DHA1 family, tetracycline resistance protein
MSGASGAGGVGAAGGRPGRSPLLFVFLTVFIDLLGFGMVLPLLPHYSAVYGATEAELGLLFACFSGMQFVFAPFWGRLSDRIGRRPVLVGGLLGTSASYALFGLAHSLPMLFASRLLAGFFGANISTASAYVADVTTPENRAKGMGLIGAAFGLGFTLGPLMGGELSVLAPSAPGFAAAGFSLCAALFGWLTLKEPVRTKNASSRVFSLAHVRRASHEPRIGVLYVLAFLSIAAFACFEAMFARFGLALFPREFDLSGPVRSATRADLMAAARVTGRYLGGIGILSALIQGGLIRRLVPRFGETKLALAGQAVLASALLAVGLAQSWPVVLVGCALMPLGFGLNNPSLNALISRASPVDEQGAYLGLSTSVASLARMSAPPLAGLAFDRWDPHAPFLLGASLLAVSVALALWYHGRYAASFPRRAGRATGTVGT